MYENVEASVMFLGYPRSGHSLVGALLDAHPQAVVAHEYDMLANCQHDWTRDQLFDALIAHTRAFHEGGGTWSGYQYGIEGTWQGGSFQTLRLVGDKKGGDSSRRLLTDPDALVRLTNVLDGLPLHIVHVVRNPLDNIATLARRQKGDGGVPLAAQEYFRLVAINRFARMHWPTHLFHELHLDDLIAQPERTLTWLAGRLGLDPDPEWLSRTAAHVFSEPRRTRVQVDWTSAVRAQVRERCATVPFLQRYQDLVAS